MGDILIEDKKSKFNMSQLILWRINNGMERASRAYLNGDFRKWYFEWRNIKYQIIGKLSINERQELINLEKQIEKKRGRKMLDLIERYMIRLTDHIEDKEIGLIAKGDETIFS